MLERSAHAPLLLCGGREQSTCCCCCSHSLTCTGNLPVSQSEALALQFVFSEARAADVDPETSNWSGTKSDPDQRRGGGHSLIIPPREDRWRVVVEVVEGLAPVYVAGNKKIKTRWQAAGGGVTGSVPTCSPDRRSPPGHRAAQHRETPGHLRTHRDTPGHTSGHFGEHSHICSCFREEVRAAALFCSFCVWSAGGRTPVGLLSSSPLLLSSSPLLSSPLLSHCSLPGANQSARYLSCSTCADRWEERCALSSRCWMMEEENRSGGSALWQREQSGRQAGEEEVCPRVLLPPLPAHTAAQPGGDNPSFSRKIRKIWNKRTWD